MATKDTDEQLLRRYEAILDEHYRTFLLLRRQPEEAIYALLAAFDSFELADQMIPPDLTNPASVQRRKGVEEGLSQAMRWLFSPVDVRPTDKNEIIAEAGEFTGYASQYVDIADTHKMYGRKQLLITVDADRKNVRFFSAPSGAPAEAMLGLVEDTEELRQRQEDRERRQSIAVKQAAVAVLAQLRYQARSGRILIDDLAPLNMAGIRDMVSATRSEDEPFLSTACDLVGFTVGEYDSFWDALVRWSYCVIQIYLKVALSQGEDDGTHMPTQVMAYDDFIKGMVLLSGLPEETVKRISERLTYDQRTGSPDIFQQPLIRGPNTIAWSTRLILRSKYRRNMLKLMARTSSLSDHTSTIVGTREGPMLQAFADMFATHGYRCKLDTEIVATTEEGQIDLLAYHPSFPNEVLLVEGKAFLGVDEINEVASATAEMIDKGQPQLRRVIQLLKKIPLAQKQTLFSFVEWDKVESYYGLVVTPGTEPNDRYDHSSIPAISLPVLRLRLKDEDFQSPKKLWEICRDRPWFTSWRGYKETYRSIPIADITYELPMIGPDEPAEEAPPAV